MVTFFRHLSGTHIKSQECICYRISLSFPQYPSFFFSENLELSCYPFPHCVIKNFIHSEAFTENLQKELLELGFHEKSNDLYKFKQVGGLAGPTLCSAGQLHGGHAVV